MAGRVSLATVLREMINSKDEKGTGCGLLALMHNTPSGQKEIAKVSITSAQPTNPDETAKYFLGRARAHAQDLEGVQTYTVLALYEGKDDAFSEQSFRAGGEIKDYSMTSEPPTEKGLLTQFMRHNEAMARAVMSHSERMLELMSHHNEKLMEENADAMTIVKELLTQKMADDYERTMKLKEMDRSTSERAMILKYLPSLVNRVTGKEIFPHSSEDTALLEMLAEKISSDQIKQLAGILPPEVVGPLYSRFVQMEKERERKQLRENNDAPNMGKTNGSV